MVELIIYAFILTAICFAGFALLFLAYFIWCIVDYIGYNASKRKRKGRK